MGEKPIYEKRGCMKSDGLEAALTRILRPLVRLGIARKVLFPELAQRLKELYVSVAAERFRLEGKRVTDSRLSLLTGLQRKDVKAIRAAGEEARPVRSAGPLPRILARWQGDPAFCDERGEPLALPRQEEGGSPSFERLVREVSRDLHPRTLLDELQRLGLVKWDADGDQVRLSAEALLPGADDEALLGYFGSNLGDHAEAATENLLAQPNPSPFFERAVHYNRLSAASLEELDSLARRLQQEALLKVNARALALQTRDREDPTARGRFRCGAFVYAEEPKPEEQE